MYRYFLKINHIEEESQNPSIEANEINSNTCEESMYFSGTDEFVLQSSDFYKHYKVNFIS